MYTVLGSLDNDLPLQEKFTYMYLTPLMILLIWKRIWEGFPHMLTLKLAAKELELLLITLIVNIKSGQARRTRVH